MTGDENSMIDLKPFKGKVVFGDLTSGCKIDGIGTRVVKVRDERGTIHNLKFHNTLLVKGLGRSLLGYTPN